MKDYKLKQSVGEDGRLYFFLFSFHRSQPVRIARLGHSHCYTRVSSCSVEKNVVPCILWRKHTVRGSVDALGKLRLLSL